MYLRIRTALAVDLVSLKPVIAPQVNQVKMSDLLAHKLGVGRKVREKGDVKEGEVVAEGF